MRVEDGMAMMVSLQRRLDNLSDSEQERQFFSHALRYLTTASGRQVEMENWMITSYEVEFGRRIGSGGLYAIFLISIFCSFCSLVLNDHSGEVFMGTWNNTQVAIKVMKTEGGVMPSSTVRR
jgi:hypothetical protein